MSGGEQAAGGAGDARWEAKLAECSQLLDGIINKNLNLLETNQKNDELESKLAAELKRNSELKARLEQINTSSTDYDKICRKLESHLTLKDSDKSRLNDAQQMMNIGKDYTGLRWDYSAPPNITKGYVKNPSKMLLECFNYNHDEMDSDTITAELWKNLAIAAATSWDDLITNKVIDKENIKNN